jgi:hypothetical protein
MLSATNSPIAQQPVRADLHDRKLGQDNINVILSLMDHIPFVATNLAHNIAGFEIWHFMQYHDGLTAKLQDTKSMILFAGV